MAFIEGILLKLAESATVAIIKSWFYKLWPTRIAGQNAPRNFFEYFGPGVSKEFVTSKVGAPHRQIGSLWLYRFADALAQFDFTGGDSARSVALALTDSSPSAGFDLPTIGTPLGKLTLDSFSTEQDGEFIYRKSSNTWELLYCTKFSPHWASNYYTFGALSLKAPGVLRESTFQTSIAEQNPDKAVKGVLVNWIGISETSDDLWFEWSIAMPTSA